MPPRRKRAKKESVASTGAEDGQTAAETAATRAADDETPAGIHKARGGGKGRRNQREDSPAEASGEAEPEPTPANDASEDVPIVGPADDNEEADAGAASSASSDSDSDGADDFLQSRLDRLKSLKSRMTDSQSANRQDVYAEFQRSKENPRDEARQERKRKLAEDLLEQKKAEESGVDYGRLRDLSYTAEDVERWDAKVKKKKEGEDKAFASFADMAAKRYAKLVDGLRPDHAAYTQGRARAEAAGTEFYRDADSLQYGGRDDRPTGEAVDRLVKDVEDQLDRRSKFSRRRVHREEDDVTYINERNARFNKKISRAYDKYTSEIKANFERGTAL